MKAMLVFTLCYGLLLLTALVGIKYFEITNTTFIFTLGALSAILADILKYIITGG